MSLLLLPFLFLRSALAVPLGPFTLINHLLFPSSNESFASPFLPSSHNLSSTVQPLASNLSALQSSTPSAPALTSGTSGVGWDWKIHITEGLWAIQAEEAPDAYIWSVQCSKTPYVERHAPPYDTTTDVADLRHFYIACWDPRGGSGPYVSISGLVDPTTLKASWSAPVRKDCYIPPPDQVHWPPDHDIAEAAAALDEPFTAIVLDVNFWDRPIYKFMKGYYPFAEVDAIDLSVRHYPRGAE